MITVAEAFALSKAQGWRRYVAHLLVGYAVVLVKPWIVIRKGGADG